MPDHTTTSSLANEWLDATLALIQKDPAAAKAAIDAMEDVTQKVRPVLALKTGETCAASREMSDAHAADVLPMPFDRERADGTHGLTRNQLSKVRAVYLMDALTKEGMHHTLATILAAVKAHNFRTDDGGELTEAAVRSHLHRLKKSGYVTMISSGVYQLTKDGFDHLQRERIGQGPLIETFRNATR